MSKRMKILHGLVILVILGGVFYWFEWRPNQVRKECAKQVQEITKDKSGLSSFDYLSLLDFCLTKHGLVK